MDKCREEFEKIEWVKERLRHVWWSQNNEYCDTGKHPRANASFLNGALHLFREQQAKVEELQTLYTQQGINMLKMQKRMDKAIRLLVEAELYQSEPNIDLAVKALKGEG